MSPAPSIGPLLGRARELDRLTRLLEAERLVTLRGTAGVGKSRLAMEVLRSRRGSVVELDGVSDRIDFVTAIAAALELAHAMGDPATAIRSALGSRGETLLVLDGAELLAQEIAALVAGWVASSASVRWIVTSRTALGISGEVVLEIEPLSVPERDASVPSSEALSFLLERITRRGGRFAEGDLPALGDLARQLGGIPHALELAADRVSLLGVGTACRSDSTARTFLAATGSDSELVASIRASVALLSREEHGLLAELSVLPQPLDDETIEAVASPNPGLTALDLLAKLRAKSLVRAVHESSGAVSETRYHVYEHVRAVVRRDTEATTAGVRERHERWLVRRAGAVVAGAESERIDGWRVLSLVGPLRELAASTELDRAISAADALVAIAAAGGPLEPAADALDKLRARRDLDAGTTLRLRAARLRVLTWLGRAHDALAEMDAALRDARSIEPAVLADAFDALGVALLQRGDASRSLESLERAVALALESGSRASEARARCSLGLALMELGRPATAREELLRAQHAALEAGAFRSAARSLVGLGGVAVDEGAVVEGEAFARELGAIADRLGDARLRTCADVLFGIVAHLRGRLDEALARYDAAVERYERTGRPRALFLTRGYRGLVRFERGELRAARRDIERAIAGLQDLGDSRHVPLYEACLAAVIAAEGDLLQARALFDEAKAKSIASGELAFEAPIELLGEHLAAASRDAELEELGAERSDGEHPPSFELEAILRALRARSSTAPDVETRIEIDRHGRFVCADGRTFRLEHRGSLRNVLAALVEGLARSPMEPLSWQAVRDAGWPGERVRDDSARQRVRTVLATLRRAGLRAALRGDARGWYLDPAAVTILD